MLDRICVGVDGSDCAQRAAAVAIELASHTGAHVDVVRVLTDDEASEGDWDGDRVLTDSRRSAGDERAAGDERHRTAVDVAGHVREGSPSSAIVAFADDRDADLVVLGRRGLGGVRDRLLGSVVHAVLRNADRPVLTVPYDEGPISFSDLLMPTDGSDVTARSVPLTATLSGQLGATVHACYVLDLAREGGLFSAGGMTADEIERLEDDHRAYLDRLAGDLRDVEPALAVESAIVRDEAHAGIADYVAANGVDLVVMGSNEGTRALGQLAGSVTGKVLGTVDVPVLVVGPDRG